MKVIYILLIKRMENSLKPERRITMVVIQILREEEYFFPKMTNEEVKSVSSDITSTPLFDSADRAEEVALTLLQHKIIRDTDKVSLIKVEKVKEILN